MRRCRSTSPSNTRIYSNLYSCCHCNRFCFHTNNKIVRNTVDESINRPAESDNHDLFSHIISSCMPSDYVYSPNNTLTETTNHQCPCSCTAFTDTSSNRCTQTTVRPCCFLSDPLPYTTSTGIQTSVTNNGRRRRSHRHGIPENRRSRRLISRLTRLLLSSTEPNASAHSPPPSPLDIHQVNNNIDRYSVGMMRRRMPHLVHFDNADASHSSNSSLNECSSLVQNRRFRRQNQRSFARAVLAALDKHLARSHASSSSSNSDPPASTPPTRATSTTVTDHESGLGLSCSSSSCSTRPPIVAPTGIPVLSATNNDNNNSSEQPVIEHPRHRNRVRIVDNNDVGRSVNGLHHDDASTSSLSDDNEEEENDGIQPGAALPPPITAMPTASILVLPPASNIVEGDYSSTQPFATLSSTLDGSVAITEATTNSSATLPPPASLDHIELLEPQRRGRLRQSRQPSDSPFHSPPPSVELRSSLTGRASRPSSARNSLSGSTNLGEAHRRFSAPNQKLASSSNNHLIRMTPYATGSQGSTKVSFVVDNVRFLVDTDLVLAHPETMLGRMLASHHFTESAPSPPHRTGGHQDHDRDSSPPSRDENSSSTNQSSVSSSHHHCRDIVLSADTPSGACISANLFRAIMQFYTEGYITCPPGLSVAELKHACDYFLIPFNQNTIRCYNIRLLLHELANEGARAVFDNFLETHLLELLVDRTRFGERECHIVVVQDDEVIVWDREHPPQMPENELPSHIVYNTSIFRFLKYNENREVAKQVLSERGLKKIRIGIESYPTSKDRLKFRPGMTRPEAIYNYVQSPFLRLSWEEEEAKSRHVDFQCVRSKSVSDLTSGLEQAVVDPLPPHLQPFRRPESPPPSGEPGPQQMPRQLPSSILPSPPLTVDASTTRPNDSSESSPLARPGDQG